MYRTGLNTFSVKAMIFVLFFTLCFSVKTEAQEVEVSSSLNPVGSGARATGMGGAFIGVADDATAASWNPAGLIQLEKPEISAVYSTFYRNQKYGLHQSATNLDITGENDMDADGLNYASVAYPFIFADRNMIISLNYQRMFEMNKDVKFAVIRDIGFGEIMRDNIEFRQDGFLYTLSPAMAVQLTPELSLGVTLNIWDDIFGDNGWDTTWTSNAEVIVGTPMTVVTSQKDELSFEGTNAHVGFLWAINSSLTLGGVYKTPFDGDVQRKRVSSQITDMPTVPVHLELRSNTTEDLTYRMPASYGLGLAYRHSDALSFAFDVYRTEWSRFVIRNADNSEVNPLTGEPIDQGRLKDTTQIRSGMEYLFIKERYVIPLRFGLFYDPEPQTGHLDEYFGFSLGTGYVRGPVAMDISYQFRTGDSLTGDVTTIDGAVVDVDQHVVMVSAIYYF